MATDMPAEIQAAHDRWQRMWSHREQLLKVARRRSMSLEDAEDAVHEAMLRAAERPDLDDERLGAWLTTVTMRLCVDRYRQVNREAEVRSSPTLVAPGPVPVEEAVCDRAEAKWLAVRSGELPARQAEALRLKSEDLDVGQVAVRMGLSYRTVESLLARARRTLRASLAGTLGLALFLAGRGRPRAGGKAQAVAVTSTAATLVVAGFVLPQALDGSGGGADAPARRPAATHSAQALRPDSAGRVRTPETGGPSSTASAAPARGATGSLAGGSLVPLSVPSLPEVASAPLPELSAPAVPQVPGLAAVPDLPIQSAVASVPSVLPVPSVPSLPPVADTSAVPSAPLPVPTPSTPKVKLP
ncbi:sigma-70 family RNA polymerase sigma factor [Streptomyces yaanensis]|uniref:Sigma-70 family RNA polymerase sigma factor n=1 Tax=Streptomyces yaanensis TaxID=1142239 RepID=A0ABV7SE28_9ACTN|nr:sigma-70 family RNA polymerase sigma factor [Streptomyces sp. CGMCC 4.7035]WNB98661.1 sigma-70 family RNA polymerase sigma factor [Streptomyces sp. CGMCC 4.7035]